MKNQTRTLQKLERTLEIWKKGLDEYDMDTLLKNLTRTVGLSGRCMFILSRQHWAII